MMAPHRELAQHEKEWIAEVDAVGAQAEALLNKFHDEPGIDEVWLAEGRAYLQIGLMCVRRAIAPRTF